MTGIVVIACYRPKPGRDAELAGLLRTHVARLRSFGLATDRAPIAMRAADGTVMEVFEWVSQEAIDAAHGHPGVQAMWGEFAAVCEYLPPAEVPGADALFTGFEPLEAE